MPGVATSGILRHASGTRSAEPFSFIVHYLRAPREGDKKEKENPFDLFSLIGPKHS